MKTYHKNPRTLTHKQQAQLLESLEDLGDLSGIVHNLDTDEIIGGNQRSSIFNVNTCEIEMTHESDTPDEQGTVGLGFIIWKEKRYTYRQVRWDAKRAERANIQANKLGGSWDFDVLANQFDVDDLLTWGFEPFELGIEPEKPEPGKSENSTLASRFIVPPFSVLDARQGYWQDRKRFWLSLGIKSELGRGSEIAPGGSLLPAATLGADGETVRGDGKGKVIGVDRQTDRQTD